MKENDAKEAVKASIFDSFESEVTNYNKEEIIRNLIAAGAKRINGCKIVAVSAAETKDNADGIRFKATLNKVVPGFDAEGNLVPYKTCFFWDNEFTINLRDNEEFAILSTTDFTERQLQMLMFGSEVDLLCEHVHAGEWQNPFTPNGKVVPVENDFVKCHIVDVKPGAGARTMLQAMQDALVQSFS